MTRSGEIVPTGPAIPHLYVNYLLDVVHYNYRRAFRNSVSRAVVASSRVGRSDYLHTYEYGVLFRSRRRGAFVIALYLSGIFRPISIGSAAFDACNPRCGVCGKTRSY